MQVSTWKNSHDSDYSYDNLGYDDSYSEKQ